MPKFLKTLKSVKLIGVLYTDVTESATKILKLTKKTFDNEQRSTEKLTPRLQNNELVNGKRRNAKMILIGPKSGTSV